MLALLTGRSLQGMLSLVHLGLCGGLSGSPAHLFPSSSEPEAGGGVEEGRAKSAKYGRTLYLPNPALILELQTKRCSESVRAFGKGEGLRGARSWDTTALLITLGVWHRVPCKKVKYKQPEGTSLRPQRCCFWGRRGEGMGQRSGLDSCL